MAQQIVETFQSRRSGYGGNDINTSDQVTKQAVDVDAAIGHKYAVAGNVLTHFTGVDEAYRTYANSSGEAL